MDKIGELVQQSIDLAEKGLFELAFAPTCKALRDTAQRSFDDGHIATADLQAYIRQHWKLINFVGIPRGSTLPADLPFRLRRAVPSFNVPDVFQEIVIFAIRQTLATSRLPIEIGFNKIGGIEVKGDKLLFSSVLIFGLLESVIFDPINKDEKIPDRYWVNIWDFKMFVSELWGREDLAERVMNLYSNNQYQS
jgi:hypothetical protein